MSCLFCEGTIPRSRRLAGSRFCSDEHSREHAARPKPRPAGRLMAAGFANFGSPTLRGKYPPARGAADPIPPYCDLVLRGPHSTQRYTIGPRRVRAIPAMPSAASPFPAAVTGTAGPKLGALALSPAVPRFLQGALPIFDGCAIAL